MIYCHIQSLHCCFLCFNGLWVQYLIMVFRDLVCDNKICLFIWQGLHYILDHIYRIFMWLSRVSMLITLKRILNDISLILFKHRLCIIILSNIPSILFIIINLVTQHLKINTYSIYADSIIRNYLTAQTVVISHLSVPLLHFMGHSGYVLGHRRFSEDSFLV